MKISLLTFALLTSFVIANAQRNIDLRDALDYTPRTSNLWGWADTAGNEYALVGLETGVSIVDITDPDNISEVQFVASPTSIWREIKTWSHYAYVTNEASGGLLIIDLANLPGSVNTAWYTGTENLNTAHTVFIDENGVAYVNGWNNAAATIPAEQRGCLMLDVHTNPMSPTVLGKYTGNYSHDCYVRNNTLWSAAIYKGFFEVIDVTDKANPVLLADQPTPSAFTHNLWLSDDGNTMYTTDERGASYVAAYDVSDLQNITELDRYQNNPGVASIPHNTYVVGDYLVTSYYKDGITIVDASDPTNLIEVGDYDTSPYVSGDGFNGCWGVYPYLPSGNIIASDIEEGLFVMTPSYQRAARIEGTVTNANTTGFVSDVHVQVIGTINFGLTDFSGKYRTGVSGTGQYDLRFSRSGCSSSIVTGVALTGGTTTTLNAALDCDLTGINDQYDENGFIYAAGQGAVQSIYYNTGNNDPEKTYIELYDIKGSLLRSWQALTPKGRIDLMDDIAAGMYVVRMQNGSSQQSTKLVKL